MKLKKVLPAVCAAVALSYLAACTPSNPSNEDIVAYIKAQGLAVGITITTVQVENINCAQKDSGVICEFDMSEIDGTRVTSIRGVPTVVPYRPPARKGNAIMRKGDKGWF